MSTESLSETGTKPQEVDTGAICFFHMSNSTSILFNDLGLYTCDIVNGNHGILEGGSSCFQSLVLSYCSGK